MTKKKKDKPLNKRFNSDDVKQWQQCANKLYKGNLTFWIEETLNANAYEKKQFVVEDSKGCRTDVYKLKRKMMIEIYGITILET